MPSSVLDRIGNFTAKRFYVIIAAVLIVTSLFLVVIIEIEPNTTAEAMNSDTEIHRAFKRYEDNFRPSMHGIPVVLEAKDGNILNMEEFRDIADALNKVSEDEIVSPMLVDFFDDSLLMNRTSIYALPMSIELITNGESIYGLQIGYHNSPQMGNDFANATDDDLDFLLDELFKFKDGSGSYIYKEMVSTFLKEENGMWKASVLMVYIAVDNDLLEVNYTYEEGGEEGKKFFEEFDLHVMDIIKDNVDTCYVYGVGVGVNDEIDREIQESGPFIMFVFIIIIIILAITFKHNLKSFLAAVIGLPLVLIWMIGISRLLNLSQTQFTAFLPILIMALGVDYAIHSMKRYDEELYEGKTPRESVRGMTIKLTGTLALAMITTFVAFFSNVFSTIPALRDWGIEAGLAIISTFVIMSFFVPSLRLAFERKKSRDVTHYSHSVENRKNSVTENDSNVKKPKRIPKNRLGYGLSKLTFKSIRHPYIIVVVIILLVLPLGYGTLNLSSEFKLEEFFNPDSELVVGLDIYTEHFPQGGEPNILLIEGDVAEPEVIKAVNTTRERLKSRGYATWYSLDITQIVQNFTDNLMVNNLVGGNNIIIIDADNDDIPDDKSQIEAILKQATTIGLFGLVDGNITMFYRPDMIREVVHYNDREDKFDVTNMQIGVAGSGSLNNIKEGMDNIEKDAQVLEDTKEVNIIVTGTAPQRYEQLTAISNSMLYSIIISIIICFIIILVIFRRLALSLVAILSVVLIAIWLYGSMYYAGYNLNIVTATIGAMSIGVGVDYSIHVCDRFRKERAWGKSFNDAMHSTIFNSGAALVFSALTTTFGFFTMLFAPMPMFYSFGLFSGLMVLLALLASVIVTPPLIKIIEGRKKKDDT